MRLVYLPTLLNCLFFTSEYTRHTWILLKTMTKHFRRDYHPIFARLMWIFSAYVTLFHFPFQNAKTLKSVAILRTYPCKIGVHSPFPWRVSWLEDLSPAPYRVPRVVTCRTWGPFSGNTSPPSTGEPGWPIKSGCLSFRCFGGDFVSAESSFRRCFCGVSGEDISKGWVSVTYTDVVLRVKVWIIMVCYR